MKKTIINYLRYLRVLRACKKYNYSPNLFYKIQSHAKIIRDIKDKNCLDIGAHYGEFTFMMQRNGNKVFSFEPSGNSFWILKRLKKKLMQNVFLFNKGLGEKKGKKRLISSEKSAMNYLSEQGKGNLVEVTTLDSLKFPKIDFIKIDVEGYELKVLKGGINLLKKNSPLILCEVNNIFLMRAGDSKEDLINFLNSLGYKIRENYGGDILFENKK